MQALRLHVAGSPVLAVVHGASVEPLTRSGLEQERTTLATHRDALTGIRQQAATAVELLQAERRGLGPEDAGAGRDVLRATPEQVLQVANDTPATWSSVPELAALRPEEFQFERVAAIHPDLEPALRTAQLVEHQASRGEQLDDDVVRGTKLLVDLGGELAVIGATQAQLGRAGRRLNSQPAITDVRGSGSAGDWLFSPSIATSGGGPLTLAADATPFPGLALDEVLHHARTSPGLHGLVAVLRDAARTHHVAPLDGGRGNLTDVDPAVVAIIDRESGDVASRSTDDDELLVRARAAGAPASTAPVAAEPDVGPATALATPWLRRRSDPSPFGPKPMNQLSAVLQQHLDLFHHLGAEPTPVLRGFASAALQGGWTDPTSIAHVAYAAGPDHLAVRAALSSGRTLGAVEALVADVVKARSTHGDAAQLLPDAFRSPLVATEVHVHLAVLADPAAARLALSTTRIPPADVRTIAHAAAPYAAELTQPTWALATDGRLPAVEVAERLDAARTWTPEQRAAGLARELQQPTRVAASPTSTPGQPSLRSPRVRPAAVHPNATKVQQLEQDLQHRFVRAGAQPQGPTAYHELALAALRGGTVDTGTVFEISRTMGTGFAVDALGSGRTAAELQALRARLGDTSTLFGGDGSDVRRAAIRSGFDPEDAGAVVHAGFDARTTVALLGSTWRPAQEAVEIGRAWQQGGFQQLQPDLQERAVSAAVRADAPVDEVVERIRSASRWSLAVQAEGLERELRHASRRGADGSTVVRSPAPMSGSERRAFTALLQSELEGTRGGPLVAKRSRRMDLVAAALGGGHTNVATVGDVLLGAWRPDLLVPILRSGRVTAEVSEISSATSAALRASTATHDLFLQALASRHTTDEAVRRIGAGQQLEPSVASRAILDTGTG